MSVLHDTASCYCDTPLVAPKHECASLDSTWGDGGQLRDGALGPPAKVPASPSRFHAGEQTPERSTDPLPATS
jgi:hypothetical protein